MASNSLIGIWAQDLWNGLGQPDCVSFLSISGYAVSVDTIGWINNRLGVCFTPSGATGNGSYNFDVTPDYTSAELAIIGKRYEVSYYRNLSRGMMGVSVGNLSWLSLAEGDEKISRINPINIGKEYAALAKQSQDELNYEINTYVQGESGPRGVTFMSPAPPVYNGELVGRV